MAEQQHLILAASGLPFQDYDAANVKRQIVASELNDDSYQVIEHPTGGYAVARNVDTPTSELVADGDVDGAADELTDVNDVAASYAVPAGPGDELAAELAAAEDVQVAPTTEITGVVPPLTKADAPPAMEDDSAADADTDTAQEAVPITDYSKGFPPHFVLNVAPRAFVHLHCLTALGILMMLMPHLLLAPLGGLGAWDNPTLGATALGIIKLIGVVLGIGAMSKFLYTYLTYRYEVTEDYVEAILGWIARDAPKTYYAHIRSTNVVQTWWERILLVGAVKLGTGATDSHEVVLKHIHKPRILEQELQKRYLPYIRSRQTN